MTTEIITVNGGEVQTAEITFWSVVDNWLTYLAKDRTRKARTLKVYRYNLSVFKNWLDEQGIEQATRQNIRDFKDYMTAKGWSVATKNLYLTTVRTFYQWLADEYGVNNIAAGIEGWRDTREHKRGFLSADEMKQLLNVVDPVTHKRLESAKNQSQRKRIILQGKRDKAILTALMAGGLRTIEISRLCVGDLKKNAGVCFLYVLGKGRESKELVKISAKAYRVIREWKDARESVDIVSDNSPLFCSLAYNSFGDTLTSLSVSRLCKEYLRAAGLKDKEYTKEDGETEQKPVVAHSLRASLATEAFKRGAKLDQVKQQLRHRNISTTQIYLEEAEKMCNPCSDLVSDAIFC